MGTITAAGYGRKLNWRRGPEDHRDQEAPLLRGIMHLPPRVDLRAFCSVIEDQGSIGSCTAHASTSAMEFLYRRTPAMGGTFMQGQFLPTPQLSRLFTYWFTRVKVEGMAPDDDGGALVRNVMKCLKKYGTCIESTWPYDTAKYAVTPPDAAVVEAKNHQVTLYYRHRGLNSVKSCIAQGYPVVFGFTCYESLESEETARTGQVKMPTTDEAQIGGHCVLAVGYDDTTSNLIFANSWGNGWGMAGFGYLPYAYVTNGLADEFFSVRREEM